MLNIIAILAIMNVAYGIDFYNSDGIKTGTPFGVCRFCYIFPF